MIPRELLKKIRQIEIRTNRLVSESVSGACCGPFKGIAAGMITRPQD